MLSVRLKPYPSQPVLSRILTGPCPFPAVQFPESAAIRGEDAWTRLGCINSVGIFSTAPLCLIGQYGTSGPEWYVYAVQDAPVRATIDREAVAPRVLVMP